MDIYRHLKIFMCVQKLTLRVTSGVDESFELSPPEYIYSKLILRILNFMTLKENLSLALYASLVTQYYCQISPQTDKYLEIINSILN